MIMAKTSRSRFRGVFLFLGNIVSLRVRTTLENIRNEG